MPPTDTSEAGLETLIVRHLTGTDGLPGSATAAAAETPNAVAAAKAGGSGWFAGEPTDYLIQHSAGSGKSNSIAWLAHQLIGVKHKGAEVFDSVIALAKVMLTLLKDDTQCINNSWRTKPSAAR
jgi:hypothetical protein